MREFCLTEEILQQFVDGELSPEQMEVTAAHVSACDACASLLGEVEQENELLMQAFAPEMSLSVPTASLRERLDVAIAGLNPQPRTLISEGTGTRLGDFFASLFGPLSLTPGRAFGFASLAVIVAFAAIFAVIQLRHNKELTPAVAVNRGNEQKAQTPTAPVGNNGTESPAAPTSSPETIPAGYKPEPRRAVARRLDKAAEVVQPEVKAQPNAEPKLLPGEKSYLEAIASLTTAIESNKDEALKPAVRADYERNLAVVDQAIATTRQQAKRNPNDRDAAEFMYTAYQNKIELLSAVADTTRIAQR